MDIGKQLCYLIKQDNITQRQLAEKLHLSATTLNGYIKNRRQPDAKTVALLASYFHTTTDYIYGLTSIRDVNTSPYGADEHCLISIYRRIPDDKKHLYCEMGITFSLSKG